jgi:nucleotide-binding universal stress UspA family protein
VTEPFHHLLVPLDGSQLTEVVLPAAVTLASRSRSRVTLLHVIEHNTPRTVHGERHLNDIPEAEAYLRASPISNGSTAR